MNSKNTVRYILGYFLGITVFIILIPYGLFSLAGFEANSPVTGFTINIYIRIAFALPLWIIGIIFMIWSNLDLFTIGKGGPTDLFGMPVTPRTKHLVVSGPYRYTRNPMVFGALSVYLAIAILLNSILGIGALVLFAILVTGYLKTFEEQRLLRDFGEEFHQYRRTVSMIVPWPPKKSGRLKNFNI